MATLYELSDAIRQVIDRGFALDEETGEITFDVTDLHVTKTMRAAWDVDVMVVRVMDVER